MDERRSYHNSVPRHITDNRKFRNEGNWQGNKSRSHYQRGQGRQSGHFRPQGFQSQGHSGPEASLKGQGFALGHNMPTQTPTVPGKMPFMQNMHVPFTTATATVQNNHGHGTVIANPPTSDYNMGQCIQTYPNSNYLNYMGGNFPQFQQVPPQPFPHQQFSQQINNPATIFTQTQINQQDVNLGFLAPSIPNFSSISNTMQISTLSGINSQPTITYTANSNLEPMKINEQLSTKANTCKAKEILSEKKAFKRKEKLGSITINEGQRDMRDLIVSMATLKHQVLKLENVLNDGLNSNWIAEVDKTECLKERLIQLQSNFNKSGDVKKLERRIAKRRKKRKRLKVKKQKVFEERQEAIVQRDIKEAKIDKWREAVTQEMFDKKQKAEMKKMADKTLNSVRSKISETSRKLDLLKGLQRLRKIRMEAAIRIGRYTPDESQESFENQISKAYSILTNQREVYQGEEKTLKVLLEAEQEENEGLAKQKKQQIEENKERIRLKKKNEMLFGKKVSFDASDPLATFYQYYNQANNNFTSFLQVRHSWDCFIVDNYVPGSSRIPDNWVLPPLQAIESWAKYLQS